MVFVMHVIILKQLDNEYMIQHELECWTAEGRQDCNGRCAGVRPHPQGQGMLPSALLPLK